MDFTQYNSICNSVWYNDDTMELKDFVKECQKAGIDKVDIPVLGQWRTDKQIRTYKITVESIKREIIQQCGISEKLKQACKMLYDKKL